MPAAKIRNSAGRRLGNQKVLTCAAVQHPHKTALVRLGRCPEKCMGAEAQNNDLLPARLRLYVVPGRARISVSNLLLSTAYSLGGAHHLLPESKKRALSYCRRARYTERGLQSGLNCPPGGWSPDSKRPGPCVASKQSRDRGAALQAAQRHLTHACRTGERIISRRCYSRR